MLHDGEVLEEMRFIANERDAALGFDRLGGDVVAADEDGSARGTVDAGDASQRGRLARAIGTDEADDLPRRDVERQAVDRAGGSVGFREVAETDHPAELIADRSREGAYTRLLKILADLERWKNTGVIRAEQYDVLSALVRKERFSVFVELHTLLYLGVVSIIAGVGWTIQTHFKSLGDAAILSALTLALAGSLYYCFSNGRAYSNALVETPGFAFDYVLYLGCLVLGLELGYLEFRFHLLQGDWDHYLLLSASVFFLLAYRFDNRFVLSLALSTLAGWFGLRLSHFSNFGDASLRVSALIYGALSAAAGAGLFRAGIKKHFLETYLHVAGNVLFIALVSALFDRPVNDLYLFALLGLAGLAIAAGLRVRRFAFVVYGIVYGYVGISARLLDSAYSLTDILAYIAISSTIVIVSLVVLARRFGRDE
jgi:hypothetical protein